MFCLYAYESHAMSSDIKEGIGTPGTGVTDAIMWVLRVKPQSCVKATSAPNQSAISPGDQKDNIYIYSFHICVICIRLYMEITQMKKELGIMNHLLYHILLS